MGIFFDGLQSIVNGRASELGASDDQINQAWKSMGFDSSYSSSKDVEFDPGSLDWLKSMAKTSPEYAEKLFDYLVNQQNVADAKAYDEYVRKHNYQWMAEDLKNAGLNPYLALNSLGGSSGTNIQAQSGTYGASSAKNTRDLGKGRILALLMASLLGASAKALSAAIMS